MPRRSLRPVMRAAGFTLVELVIVLVIFALLAGLLLPTYLAQVLPAQLDSTAERFTALLQQARLEAMRRGQPVRVRLDVDQRKLLIESIPTERELRSGALAATEAQSDPFVEITPMWADDLSWPSELEIRGVLTNPPSLRLLLLEQIARDAAAETIDASEQIDNSFDLQSSFEEEPIEVVDDDVFAPIQFEPDGSMLNRIPLRVILAEAQRSSEGEAITDAASAKRLGSELDPQLNQRWITIDGMTGRVYSAKPSMRVIELANEYRDGGLKEPGT